MKKRLPTLRKIDYKNETKKEKLLHKLHKQK